MTVRASSSRSRPFTAAIHELTGRTDPALLLDREGTILFANDAWDRLARENGGLAEVRVGEQFLDGVPGEETRSALRLLLARVAQGTGPRPAAFSSECNGPDVARLVTTQISPILAGEEAIGLTLIQRVVRQLPAGEVYPVVEGTAAEYRDGEGALVQCHCCRRTRRPGEPDEWDFVPGLVAAPPEATRYETCPLCHELHAPQPDG